MIHVYLMPPNWAPGTGVLQNLLIGFSLLWVSSPLSPRPSLIHLLYFWEQLPRWRQNIRSWLLFAHLSNEGNNIYLRVSLWGSNGIFVKCLVLCLVLSLVLSSAQQMSCHFPHCLPKNSGTAAHQLSFIQQVLLNTIVLNFLDLPGTSEDFVM